MKIVKYSMVALVLAMVVNFVSVAADDSVRNIPATGYVTIAFDEIKPGGSYSTYKFNRTGDSLQRQSYYFEWGATTITNPCPSCRFKSTLNYEGSTMGSVTGTAGTNEYFPEKSRFDGIYQVTIKRDQITAVNSYHTGLWYIKAKNPALPA